MYISSISKMLYVFSPHFLVLSVLSGYKYATLKAIVSELFLSVKYLIIMNSCLPYNYVHLNKSYVQVIKAHSKTWEPKKDLSTTRLVCAFQTEGGCSIYNSHLFPTIVAKFPLIICLLALILTSSLEHCKLFLKPQIKANDIHSTSTINFTRSHFKDSILKNEVCSLLPEAKVSPVHNEAELSLISLLFKHRQFFPRHFFSSTKGKTGHFVVVATALGEGM